MPSVDTDPSGPGGRAFRVLVTRPLEDAQPLADALEARGHSVVLEPLLGIVPRGQVDWPEGHNGAQALLVTSANGIRAFARLDPRRDLTVLAVGDASAAAARTAGFSAVCSAAGTVEDLAALVQARLKPEAGPLLQPAASKLAGDLKGSLESRGFRVLRVILYDAGPVRQLSDDLRRRLDSQLIDVVTFFSPRTAATFASLLGEAGLSKACGRITALCLSRAVADTIAGLPWRSVVVADRPDQAALLARLDALAANGE